ncbi:tRNA glutamyl-Q(34) synthetase GluQRS [Orbaceae bacterium ESL0721]|nr:tRNA glutamyl-Q(34) synthetase GluQRS [Orbaceae bacterium ESL0721]
MDYIGRFAPSPSGPLHFGSLVTALGSYLQAKSKQGKWLVRIEDIDPPREVAGASAAILKSLEALGLHWDGEVLYQSNCTQRYLDLLDSLILQQQAYYCDCSRKRIQNLDQHLLDRQLLDQQLLNQHIYDGFCRDRQLLPTKNGTVKSLAIRLRQTHPVYQFYDHICGWQSVAKSVAEEDFILQRRDGLFAYNLAVVLDDHLQGITEIVRGADLLPVTAKQISFYQLLNWQAPTYCHLPLVLDPQGNKLSKQNHAKPLDLHNLTSLTADALQFLGQPLPDCWQDATQIDLINWAILHWDVDQVPKVNRQYRRDFR